MAFVLVQLGNKKVTLHRSQLLNRQHNTADCVFLGEKHHVVIDGFNDDYELLNQFAEIHNSRSLYVKLVNSYITHKDTPRCNRINESREEPNETLVPRNIFANIANAAESAPESASQFDESYESMEGIMKDIPSLAKNSTPVEISISPPPLVPIGESLSVDSSQQVSPDHNLDGNTPVKPRRINKANICKYCYMKNTNIRRHITSMHKDEEEVKEFLMLSEDNPKKNMILSQIRRDGNFLGFKEKDYVLSRKKTDFDAKDYIACKLCKIVVKKTSLRRHFQRSCTKSSSVPSQNLMRASKALSEPIHDISSTTMRNLIFPAFREGPVKEAIRFDRMILLYGNEMCLKYRSQHHFAMIRNRMIGLAKMLLQIKSSVNDVEDLKDILKPKYFDNIMKVVSDMGEYNSTTGNYDKPTLPTEIGTSVKYVIRLFISECIKDGNMELKKEAKNLFHLLQTALPAHVNKTAAESLLQHKRQKTSVLPSMDDIQKLNVFLLRGRVMHHAELEKKFSLYHWTQLGKFTLVTILLFNRRRPGEKERALVSDLNTIKKISRDDEIYGKLSDEERLCVDSYMRFVIRGKLARGVPVLLHKDVYGSIKLLLRYREQAGVLQGNPFIFAIPQNQAPDNESTIYRHHIATNLIRQFSEKCGAKNPSTLRATILRKHVATFTTTMNLDTDDLDNFQNYMGHADKIHREYYRQPIIEKDILKVSKVLLMAQGRCSAAVGVTQERGSTSTQAATTLELTAPSSSSTSTNLYVNDDEDSPRTSVEEYSYTYPDSTKEASTSVSRSCTPFSKDSDSNEDDNYIPQESDKDDDINEDLNREKPCRKRRRLFDMTGGAANIKRRWSTSEKEAVWRIFASEFNDGKIPTLSEIKNAIVNCSELKKRTLPQIRLWIVNNMNKKPTTRRTWDSPAKKTIRETFDRYITGPLGSYPSTSIIMQTISTNESLKNMTPRRIRSQIQNQKRLFHKRSSFQQ